jgi:hypothetical protein
LHLTARGRTGSGRHPEEEVTIMPSTAFDLNHKKGGVSWPLGTYLTDGERLLYVIDTGSEIVQLEDSCSECLESWPMLEAAARLREVTPCSPAVGSLG